MYVLHIFSCTQSPGYMSYCESSKHGRWLYEQPVIRSAFRQRAHVNGDPIKKQGHTNLKWGPITTFLLMSLLCSKNPPHKARQQRRRRRSWVLDLQSSKLNKTDWFKPNGYLACYEPPVNKTELLTNLKISSKGLMQQGKSAVIFLNYLFFLIFLICIKNVSSLMCQVCQVSVNHNLIFK